MAPLDVQTHYVSRRVQPRCRENSFQNLVFAFSFFWSLLTVGDHSWEQRSPANRRPLPFGSALSSLQQTSAESGLPQRCTRLPADLLLKLLHLKQHLSLHGLKCGRSCWLSSPPPHTPVQAGWCQQQRWKPEANCTKKFCSLKL